MFWAAMPRILPKFQAAKSNESRGRTSGMPHVQALKNVAVVPATHAVDGAKSMLCTQIVIPVVVGSSPISHPK